MCGVYHFYAILTLWSVYGLNYKWIPNDDRWDCVVGISLEGKIPLSTGVLITTSHVATSANPVENYDFRKLKIHVIDGAHDRSRELPTVCMMTTYFHPRSHDNKHGFDGKHSPTHDFIIIRATNATIGKYLYGENPLPRWPFRIKFGVSHDKTAGNKDWRFGGFGYIDEDHIKENTELEIESFSEPVLEDCDEWIPREWGQMICIRNNDFLKGVASGSPLFHRGLIYGIGSFELTKGNESILVFTDTRPFAKYYFFCLGQNRTAIWWYAGRYK